MKYSLTPEMINLIEGGYCNCVARAVFIYQPICQMMSNGHAGGVASMGMVSHASVCKDMIGNMTLSECSGYWDFKFVGCYPQDDIGMQKYLRQ